MLRCLSAHAQALRLVVSCPTGLEVMVEYSAACNATHRKALEEFARLVADAFALLLSLYTTHSKGVMLFWED